MIDFELTFQIVVIIVIWVISLLVIYMLFLICLEPLLNKRLYKTTGNIGYQEHSNEEVTVFVHCTTSSNSNEKSDPVIYPNIIVFPIYILLTEHGGTDSQQPSMFLNIPYGCCQLLRVVCAWAICKWAYVVAIELISKSLLYILTNILYKSLTH